MRRGFTEEPRGRRVRVHRTSSNNHSRPSCSSRNSNGSAFSHSDNTSEGGFGNSEVKQHPSPFSSQNSVSPDYVDTGVPQCSSSIEPLPDNYKYGQDFHNAEGTTEQVVPHFGEHYDSFSGPKENMSLPSTSRVGMSHSSLLDVSLNSEEAENLEYLTSCVYHNDLIMRHIVENVVTIHDRVNVELTCQRLYRISRSAAWKFTSQGDHFSLSYKTLNTHISVELGDVWFVIPSVTLETRRESREQNQLATRQPEKLMTTLHGMATRFALGIKRITIGGSDQAYKGWGVRNHQLIVTVDLLRFINDRLLGVQSIVFRECGFDREAVEYLASPECKLADRIQELSLLAVWIDGDARATDFVKLLGSQLTRLRLSQLVVDTLGAEIVMKLRGMQQLDTIRVVMEQYHNLSPEQSCWYVQALAKRCKWIEVKLKPDYDTAKAIVDVAAASVNLKNLTVLEVDHMPKGRYENRNMAFLFENLSKMTSLRVLRIGGWTSRSLARCLAQGLRACYTLESLTLKHVSRDTSTRALTELCMALPPTLDTLDLDDIYTFDNRHLEIVANNISNLRCLRLARLVKVSPAAILQAIGLLNQLSYFHCEIALSVHVAGKLCDSRLLPSLRKASFTCTTRDPVPMLNMLSDFFLDVSCLPHFSHSRWSFVRVANRRVSAPAYPTPEAVSKTESKRVSQKPRQSTKNRKGKMDWDDFA